MSPFYPVIQASRLGLGCAGLSGCGMLNTLLSHDDECSFIREAFSKGVTFFDTSDVYRFMHDNEFMIGKVRVAVIHLSAL